MRSSRAECNYLFKKAVEIGLIDVPLFFVSYKCISCVELRNNIATYGDASIEEKKELFTTLKEKIKLAYINDDTTPLWKHAELMGIIDRGELFLKAFKFKKECGKEARRIIFLSITEKDKACILFRSLYKKYIEKNSIKRVNLTTAEIIASSSKSEDVKNISMKELALQQRSFIESIDLKLMEEDCYTIEELRDLSQKIGLSIFARSKKELEQAIIKYVTNTKLYALAVVSNFLL